VVVEGAGSAVGAALLAAAGAAREPLVSVVDRLVPTPRPVQPDERTAAAATELWDRFRRLLTDAGHDSTATPAPSHPPLPGEKEHR
jgi:sugar (pentulose or hexulose) kinase